MRKVSKTLGEILYEARIEKKMTLEEVSYAADVAESAIRSWEGDKKSPMISNLQKLCKALRIEIVINENGEVEKRTPISNK